VDAGEAVRDHELAAVARPQLLGGVEQFDPADGAGLVDVYEDVVGQADGLDVALPFAEADSYQLSRFMTHVPIPGGRWS
jgi:hypothetical protein